MKLPLPSFSSKHPRLEYYLALLLLDEKVNAVILQEIDGKLQVIDSQEEVLKRPLEEAEKDEWIETVDRAISRAEEKLPPDIETHKTVFGVKEDWTDETKIKKDYLDKLKELGQALDLKPIGFIVISEAIIKLIQDEDGSPLSAILVEESGEKITVTLIRAGKAQGKEVVEKKDSFAESVDDALKRFAEPTLPPRIILYSKDEGEDVSQALISHRWSKTLPFLHVPQITVLPEGFAARAVVAGAASQMGFAVPKNFLDELSPDLLDQPVIPPDADRENSVDDEEAKEELGKGTVEEDKKSPVGVITGESFGFAGTDAEIEAGQAQSEPEEPKDEEHKPDEPQNKAKQPIYQGDAAAFGFSSIEKSATMEEHNQNETSEKEDSAGIADNPTRGTRSLPFLASFSLPFQKIRVMFGLLPRLVTGSRFSKVFLLVPLVLVVLLAVVFFYFFKMHATVTLYVKANNISLNRPVTFSTGSASDFSRNVIAATTETADLDGSVSANTTGSKEVGDKAKGKVTIYNSSSRTRTIAAGTVITSGTSNKLAFTLDDSISVASSSGDIFSGIKSGTTQVTVTAQDIGTDYNLPSGTTFSISGDSSLAAKNDSAFSGGTKKTVTVVSEKDRTMLLDKLKKSLEKRAMDVLGQKIQSDQTLFPFFVDETVTKANYSKAAGDQASTVTLNGTVSFTGAAYKKDDLSQFATKLLASQYNDLDIASGSLKYDFSGTKQKDNADITSTITVHAGLLPKLNTQQLAREITGKSLNEAENILDKKPQVNSSSITLSPNIPLLPKILPRQERNIRINISTQ